jgi:hypothetical protein
MRRKVFLSFASVLLLTMLTTVSAFADHSSASVLGGSANFRDANAQSDSFVTNITGATVLSAGSTYQGWLVDEAGTKLSLGVYGPGPDLKGTYTSPSKSDLLADYKTFLVTIEPKPDDSSSDSGNVAYGDFVPSHTSDAITALIQTAGQLKTQANAIQSSANSAEAAVGLASQQSSAQAVIDAIGALKASAENASVQAADIKANAAGDTLISTAADAVVASASNTIAIADKLNTTASRVTAATAAGLAVDLELDNVKAVSAQLISGDDSGNGSSGLYINVQDIGAMNLVVGTPPATGDSMLITVIGLVLAIGVLLMISGGILYRRRPLKLIA